MPLYRQQLTQRQAESLKAIEKYEQFSFLYACLLQQFNIFDRNGQPRKRKAAEADAKCAIDWLKELDITNLNKELKLIDKLLPDLFNFLDKAQDSCQKIVESGLVQANDLPFWAIKTLF